MRRSGTTCVREWFCASVCFSLLIAPFGCQLTTNIPLDDAGGSNDSADASNIGLFVNQDIRTPALGAARAASGDQVFVFGTRDASGNPQEIESILGKPASGGETYVNFESGRPVYARALDGSYADVTYRTLSLTNIAADIVIFNASDGSKSSYSVNIDLQQTAAQVASLIEQHTGIEIPEVSIADAATSKPGAPKTAANRVTITVFSPLFSLFVVPLVATVGFMTVVLGQALLTVYTVLVVAVQTVAIALLFPIYLIAAILTGTIQHIELVPLTDLFGALPPQPTIILL